MCLDDKRRYPEQNKKKFKILVDRHCSKLHHRKTWQSKPKCPQVTINPRTQPQEPTKTNKIKFNSLVRTVAHHPLRRFVKYFNCDAKKVQKFLYLVNQSCVHGSPVTGIFL